VGLAGVCKRAVVVVAPATTGATVGGDEGAHVTAGVSKVVEDRDGRGDGAAAEGAVPAT
jgi:hypothetical protein